MRRLVRAREAVGWLFLVALSGIHILHRSGGIPSPDLLPGMANHSCDPSILTRKLNTAGGPRTYKQLIDGPYSQLGYRLAPSASNCRLTDMILPLELPSESCSDTFAEWVTVQHDWLADANRTTAPRELTAGQELAFTLGGVVNFRTQYRDDSQPNSDAVRKSETLWNEELINRYQNWYRRGRFDLLPYGQECSAVFNALRTFSPRDQIGMVIGSRRPWVEAMLLYHGAKSVITAEYGTQNVTHPRLRYVHPVHLSDNWLKFTELDFVVSFSSIEHSGLARYGDPLDPIGDLREMRKIHCLLKPGGLLFLGVPTGPDTVVFNLHRIYGPIRWPLLAAGFEVIGAFEGGSKRLLKTLFTKLHAQRSSQPLVVLMKIG